MKITSKIINRQTFLSKDEKQEKKLLQKTNVSLHPEVKITIRVPERKNGG